MTGKRSAILAAMTLMVQENQICRQLGLPETDSDWLKDLTGRRGQQFVPGRAGNRQETMQKTPRPPKQRNPPKLQRQRRRKQ